MAKYHFPEKKVTVEAQNLREALLSFEKKKPAKKKAQTKKKNEE
jgi:hypothetical protein